MVNSIQPSKRFFWVIAIGVAIGASVTMITIYAGRLFALAPIAAILLLYLGIKFPEVFFALFLTAGYFKADPRNPLPAYIDLTVVLGAVVIIGIAYQIWKKGLKIPVLPWQVVMPYAGLTLLMITSLLYTSAPTQGIDKFLKFVTFTTLATFAPLFLFKDLPTIRRFFYVLIFLSTGLALEAVFLTSSRTPSSATYLAFARITGLSMLIISLYFVMIDRIPKKILWIAVGIINLAGFVIAGAKAPVIAMAATIVLVTLFSVGTKMKKSTVRILAATVIAVVGSGLVIYLFPELTETLLRRFEMAGADALDERSNLMQQALQLIASAPLTGVGIGGAAFATYYRGETWYYQFPHNIVLEFGAELGLIGMCLFLGLIGFCFQELFHLKRKSGNGLYFLVVTVFALYIYMLLNSLVAGSIRDDRLLFVWIGVIYSLGKFLPGSASRTQNPNARSTA
jgi:O-antigen ligase